MDAADAQRAAIAAGAVTTVVGAALLSAPHRVGALVGFADPLGLRAVGAVDLAIAGGLLAGRPRWPWLAARAAANPPTAAYLFARARQAGARLPIAAAAAVTLISVVDLRAAQALRAAGR